MRVGRLVPFLVGFGIASCESAETAGGAACTVGQTMPCEGVDGCVGTSTCRPDLSAFGACDCGGDGATGDAGPTDASLDGD